MFFAGPRTGVSYEEFIYAMGSTVGDASLSGGQGVVLASRVVLMEILSHGMWPCFAIQLAEYISTELAEELVKRKL